MTLAARRRTLRWIFYPAAGLLLVAGLALTLYLRSEHPGRYLAAELRRKLAEQVAGPCDFEGLTLSYLPPAATVTGISCAQPKLTLARAEATLSLGALLRRQIVIDDLDLFQPSIVWDADADRLPERVGPAGPGVPAARRLTLRRVRIHGGSATIGSERRDLSAELHELLLTADSDAEPGFTSALYAGPWDGTFSFARGSARLGEFALSGVQGSVSFAIDSGGARTRRLHLKAEAVDITGTGDVRAGDPPHLTLDLFSRFSPQSPALTHPLPQITAGEMQASAIVDLAGRGLVVQGAFSALDAELDPDRRSARKDDNGPMPPWRAAAAAGTFTYQAGTAAVETQLTGVAGGSARVRYKTEGGLSLPLAEHEPRSNTLGIDADNMFLAEMLKGLGKLPGDEKVVPSASVTGRVQMTWEAGQLNRAAGSADLTLTPVPGDLPLAGSIAMEWRGRRVTVRRADVELPQGRLEGSGSLDFDASPARYDLVVDLDAREIGPVMTFVQKRWSLGGGSVRPVLAPADLSGPATVHAEIEGPDTALHVRGGFTSDGLVVRLPVAGVAEGPESRFPLKLDHSEGTFNFGPDGLLVDAPRLVAGEMLASLRADEPPGTWPTQWTISLNATHAPASFVARLLGQKELAFKAGGTIEARSVISSGLDGALSLSSSDLSLYGEALHPARLTARLEGGRLELENLHAEIFGGVLSATGTLDLGGEPPRGVIELSARDLDLAAAGASLKGLDPRGVMQLDGRIRIDGAATTEGTFTQQGVAVSGMDLGNVSGRWSGPVERLHVELEDDRGDLRASGELIRQRGDPVTGDPDRSVTLLDATVEVHQLSLDDISPLLPATAPQGLRGEADGVVTIRGPLHAPELIEIRAQVARLELAAGDLLLHNQDPVDVTLSDRFLTIASTRLVGERTDLAFAGSISLTGSHDITARLDGSFDLGLLQVLYPDMRASGPCTAALRFLEREDRMTYLGTIELNGGRISHPALPMPIDDLAARGLFDEQGVLRITGLQGALGGGRFTGSGDATFEGASLPRAHLAVRGLGVRAEILSDLRAFFDADLTLDKQGSTWRLGGLVQIQRAVYEREFGISPTEVLVRSREFRPGETTSVLRERPAKVLLDFDIIAESNVWIRNRDALIEASAHLTIEGTLDRPEISGNISAMEGGTFRFRDVVYSVRGGSLDFSEPTKIDPLLDIKAATQVQHYEILLEVSGRYSKPVFELTSEPALPQRDIVWLLLTGHTLTDNASQASVTAAESQIAAYLAAPVAGAISGAALAPLEKLPGIYSVSIDPYFLNGTADPSARLTVTSRASSALLFTYSTALGTAGEEIYQIEYNPGRIWDLIGTRDADGSLSADVRFRRRWRAGPSSPEVSPSLALGEVSVGSLAIIADRMPGSAAALRRKIDFDEGDTYRRGDLLEGREALRLYYIKHGYPAVRVELIDEPQADNPALHKVTYAINAGPAHEIVFEGVDSSRRLRSAVRDAWKEPILFENPVQEARAATEITLKESGYYRAKVSAEARDVGPQTREVRLDVDPGKRVRVRSIAIRGNEALYADRIQRQMLTRENGLFTRGLLKEKVLAEDAAAIRSLYQAQGYLDAVVPPPVVTFTPDGREADIVVNIREGRRSIISAVRFTDDAGAPVQIPELPEAELFETARMHIGDAIDPVELGEAADRVRQALDAKGYSRPLVSYSLSGPPEASEVNFSVSAGEMLRVRRVRVDGNSRTRSALIKKEVTVQEGDRLSRAALLDIQRRLYGLGVFRSVNIVAEPVAGSPGHADVHVRVQEGPHILTAWGLGYNTENLLGASFELADNNLFGTRRSAGLFLRGSARDWRVQVSLRDPNLFGEKIETLLSGFVERQETSSFTTHRRAATFQLNRKFSEQLRLFGGYRIEDVDLRDLQISPQAAGLETARIGSIGGAVTWDTRNDLVNPRRGGISSLALTTAHPSLASEVTFDKAYASLSRFISLGRRVVLGTSLRAGWIFSQDDTPASERFFAGGDTTLRGFNHNEVGPEDPNTGEPIGGDSLFLFNEELRFQVWKSLQGVTFFDAGNVYSDSSDFDLGDMRAAAGLGLRLNTPVGPFRVEYGWKLDRQPGESAGEFFFSIGQAF